MCIHTPGGRALIDFSLPPLISNPLSHLTPPPPLASLHPLHCTILLENKRAHHRNVTGKEETPTFSRVAAMWCRVVKREEEDKKRKRKKRQQEKRLLVCLQCCCTQMFPVCRLVSRITADVGRRRRENTRDILVKIIIPLHAASNTRVKITQKRLRKEQSKKKNGPQTNHSQRQNARFNQRSEI